MLCFHKTDDQSSRSLALNSKPYKYFVFLSVFALEEPSQKSKCYMFSGQKHCLHLFVCFCLGKKCPRSQNVTCSVVRSIVCIFLSVFALERTVPEAKMLHVQWSEALSASFCLFLPWKELSQKPKCYMFSGQKHCLHHSLSAKPVPIICRGVRGST